MNEELLKYFKDNSQYDKQTLVSQAQKSGYSQSDIDEVQKELGEKPAKKKHSILKKISIFVILIVLIVGVTGSLYYEKIKREQLDNAFSIGIEGLISSKELFELTPEEMEEYTNSQYIKDYQSKKEEVIQASLKDTELFLEKYRGFNPRLYFKSGASEMNEEYESIISTLVEIPTENEFFDYWKIINNNESLNQSELLEQTRNENKKIIELIKQGLEEGEKQSLELYKEYDIEPNSEYPDIMEYVKGYQFKFKEYKELEDNLNQEVMFQIYLLEQTSGLIHYTNPETPIELLNLFSNNLRKEFVCNQIYLYRNQDECLIYAQTGNVSQFN